MLNGVTVIAAESQAWPRVTRPPGSGPGIRVGRDAHNRNVHNLPCFATKNFFFLLTETITISSMLFV